MSLEDELLPTEGESNYGTRLAHKLNMVSASGVFTGKHSLSDDQLNELVAKAMEIATVLAKGEPKPLCLAQSDVDAMQAALEHWPIGKTLAQLPLAMHQR